MHALAIVITGVSYTTCFTLSYIAIYCKEGYFPTSPNFASGLTAQENLFFTAIKVQLWVAVLGIGRIWHELLVVCAFIHH